MQIIILILILSLFSCNISNDTTEPNKIERDNDNNTQDYILSECNPIDSVGYLHNACLDYCFNKMKTQDTTHWINDLFFFNDSIYLKKSVFDTLVYYAKLFFIDRGYSISTINHIANSFIHVLNLASFFKTNNGIEYIDNIVISMPNLIHTSYSLGNMQYYEYSMLHPIGQYLRIFDLYKIDSCFSTLDLCNLSFHDSLSFLFGSKSIYYHSKMYWEQYLSQNSFINLYKNNIKQPYTMISESAFLMAADALGTVIGSKGGGFGMAFGSAVASFLAVLIYDAGRCPVCNINHNINDL